MSHDDRNDDVEKLAHAIGLIGEAFAAMSREIGKHLADFGKQVSDAFDEAADERTARETDHRDDYGDPPICGIGKSTDVPHPYGNHGKTEVYGFECQRDIGHVGVHRCGCGVEW